MLTNLSSDTIYSSDSQSFPVTDICETFNLMKRSEDTETHDRRPDRAEELSSQN